MKNEKNRLFEMMNKVGGMELNETELSYGTEYDSPHDDSINTNESMISENMGGYSPIHKYVMFAYNYPSNFIEEVWADDQHIANHLKEKFSGYYNQYGSQGVLNAFYVNLDAGNQQKLEDWIINNYNG